MADGQKKAPDGGNGRSTSYPPLEEVQFALDEPLVPFVEEIAPLVPDGIFLMFTFGKDGGFQIHEKAVSIDQMCAARSWLDARILRYFSTEQQLAERRRAIARQQNAGG